MRYEILEVHLTYKNGQLVEVAVVWVSNSRGWVRATLLTTDSSAGYGFLMPGENISPLLIQKTAGQGMTLSDMKKKKYFPSYKDRWEN